MTVLVTGGCGYIGAHVVHALHQAGEKVVVVDDLSYGKPTRIEGSRLYGMDIVAPGAGERLAEILDAEGVDSVIHFAARKQVGESVEKPLWYYQQNINGMLNVLTGMTQSKNAKKLVFSSSAATYGVPPVDVVPEDVVPMLPINPYGQTKLFGEWMARACEQPFGIRFCALRYFNVAGCGPVELEDPAILNLIPMLFDRLKKGKAPAIFGDDYRPRTAPACATTSTSPTWPTPTSPPSSTSTVTSASTTPSTSAPVKAPPCARSSTKSRRSPVCRSPRLSWPAAPAIRRT